MPLVPLLLWVLTVIVAVSIIASFQVVGLLLMLGTAALVGALANALIPGRLPSGWVGALLAGMAGSWLGTILLGHWGPRLFSIYLLPTFIGAVLVVFLVQLLTGVLGARAPR